MERYAITLCKGNNERLIEYAASKEDGLIIGAKQRSTISPAEGVIALIQADFSNYADNGIKECRVYEVWQ